MVPLIRSCIECSRFNAGVGLKNIQGLYDVGGAEIVMEGMGVG